MKNSVQRILYVDIIKTICICGIVFLHAFPELRSSKWYIMDYFYIVGFFFVGGYLYRRRGIIDTIVYLLKKLYIPFVLLNLFALAFGRIASKYISYVPSEGGLFEKCFRIMLFDFEESMMIPSWFMFSFAGTFIVYGLIDRFVTKNVIKTIIITIIFIVVLCNMSILRGIIWCKHPFVIVIGVMLPFYHLGRVYRNYEATINSAIKYRFGVFLICCIYLVWLRNYTDFDVDLYPGIIENRCIFPIAMIVGIYILIYLSRIIAEIPAASYMSFVGRYSLYIMLLHFMVFSMISILYTFLINAKCNYTWCSCVDEGHMKLVSALLGIAIPTMLGMLNDKVKICYANIKMV